MTRQRLIPMTMVAAMLSLLLVTATSAGSRTSAGVVISPRGGLGIWIGRDVERHGHRGPFHGPMAPGPWPRRFAPVWTPLPRVVVVSPPVPVIEPELATITVWITNSNGSMTSIQLTREGPWYRGPRGEYYTSVPTNEQLRVVYGF